MTTTTASTQGGPRDEIRKALSKAGLKNITNDILTKCVSLSSLLQLSSTQMAECWEALSLSKNIVDLTTESSFESYRNELVKESNAVVVMPTTTKDHTTTNNNDIDEDGAIVTRMAVKRQMATPKSNSLPMVTPPSKRLHVDSSTTDGVNNNNIDEEDNDENANSPVLSAVDAVASTSKTNAATTPSPIRSSTSSTSATIQTTMNGSINTKTNSLPPQYESRTNNGQILVTFDPSNRSNNAAAASSETKSDTTTSTTTTCHIDNELLFGNTNAMKPYRHMFTPVVDRSKALKQQLLQVGQVMEEFLDLEGGALAPVGVPRQDTITCLGRICNEAHEGRINPTSVVLEGSEGCRINVDLSILQSSKLPFSLFPGQIVAMEGLNSTGRKLVAHRIVSEGVPHPPMKTPVSQLLQYYPGGSDAPALKVMTVCGPYTTSLNLDYEPLVDLMAVILDKRPDVVIMTGPFVDMNHPLVKSGMTTIALEDGSVKYVPFEVLFAEKITLLLAELYEEQQQEGDEAKDFVALNTQFVIVPSLDDATAEWVYPQPPFQDRLPKDERQVNLPDAKLIEFGTHGFHHLEAAASRHTSSSSSKQALGRRHVHLVSNPCTFSVNEVVFGVTSTDVLFHMSADETNANLEPFSRLPRLAQHLLQQRNYYALFPPHATVPVDLKRMEQWSMPCRPDVLIVPSKLQCFCKTVLGSTVVLNPGRLTRETTGGTYALMEIYPMSKESLELAAAEDAAMLEHAVPDRIRVEIKNI